MAIGIDSHNESATAKANNLDVTPVIDRRMPPRRTRVIAKKQRREFGFFLPVAAMLLALVMTISIMSAFVSLTSDVTAYYTDHLPITIDGDADFLVGFNGVTSGTGTEADPYVIWGWNIDTTVPATPGIIVMNTQAHFVIDEVWVHGDQNADGIELINVRNGSVENSRLDNNSAAFYLQDCFGLDITNVTMMNNPNYGIYSYASNCWNVTDSTLNLNGYGAYVDPAVDSVRFDNCSISWNDYGGLYFYNDISNVEIVDCEIDHNDYGQGLYVYGESTGLVVRNCSISYTAYDALYLDDSCNGIELSNNTVIDNGGFGLYVYGGGNIIIAN
ncbi:MAG: right-handed parallel beta-helix repeat-containing protein, partial [Thermoplasmata archaeon]|nr:right-handed parallel beta-helix repeat-containing protein [Thermoplasmata archaeon]